MGDSKKSAENDLLPAGRRGWQPHISCTRDISRLRGLFYQSYDPSLFLSFLADNIVLTRLATGWSFIGEGYHFQSFRVHRGGPIPLVISLATSGFAQGLISGHNGWCEAMAHLKTRNLPLIPPFEILRHTTSEGEKIAYITPYGGQKEEMASPHWQPLRGHIELLTDGLLHGGLRLRDIAQIRCLEGIPFIIDWSDLVLEKGP